MLEKLPDAIGHALRGQRAGLEKTAFQAVDLRGGMAALTVTSLAFADHAPIPERYTADGAGLSPPLQWRGAPAAATSLVLIVEDADAPTPHIAHPGCFATAALLASVPLLALDLTEPRLFVTGITGSTGSGRKPVDGTHHPQRHSDLYAYNALSHRHTPEIIACAKAASGVDAEFNFVPHSGPFARGIHVTIQATLKKPLEVAAARTALADFYRHSPFVLVGEAPPHVKDVATSNYARLSAATHGSTIAVMVAIDNLNKGAAGGAVQWMNRLLRIPESTGLTAPAPGWT